MQSLDLKGLSSKELSAEEFGRLYSLPNGALMIRSRKICWADHVERIVTM
jgi:hypothetical protein